MHIQKQKWEGSRGRSKLDNGVKLILGFKKVLRTFSLGRSLKCKTGWCLLKFYGEPVMNWNGFYSSLVGSVSYMGWNAFNTGRYCAGVLQLSYKSYIMYRMARWRALFHVWSFATCHITVTACSMCRNKFCPGAYEVWYQSFFKDHLWETHRV